jgi:hypothetical protein
MDDDQSQEHDKHMDNDTFELDKQVDQDEFLEIDQWMNNINSPVIAMYR